jgi:DNA repair ATPase RecN
MDYNKIVSVTGMPGLFELLSSKSDGAVVRSLDDNSTKFVSTRQHNFSHLESIEVYTTKDNTNLAEVFEAMKKSEEKIPDAKADNKTLKAYFEKVFPDLDFDRVYASDMKKMVKWYHIIEKNNIEIKIKTEEEKEAAADLKNVKATHVENAHVNMKPQQSNPRKIESRGVK